MKVIALLFVLFSSIAVRAEDLSEVRLLYKQSARSAEACKKLYVKVEKATTNQTTLLAYKASATMMMARYVWNPIDKMKYFKKGKKIMEEAVLNGKENIEVRFLRWMVQDNLPSFLGYKNNIAEDRSFVLSNLNGLSDQALKVYISQIVSSTKLKK